MLRTTGAGVAGCGRKLCVNLVGNMAEEKHFGKAIGAVPRVVLQKQ